MSNPLSVYVLALSINQQAFEDRLYTPACHALDIALCYAWVARDAEQMEEVKARAEEQKTILGELLAPSADAAFQFKLFCNLVTIAHTYASLLQLDVGKTMIDETSR